MTMGDRIMVLHDGKVQQTGTPLELYNTPANTFVAGFIGSPQMNLAEATLDGDTLVLNHSLAVPLTTAEKRNLPEGSHWKVGVRPEPVSYTHLDVYKRQLLPYIARHFADHRAFHVYNLVM